MPWCDECAKFWNPPSLADGRCPSCGAVLDRPEEHIESVQTEPHQARVPWHFKLLVVALVLYLAFRAYQGVLWLTHHL